MACPNKLCLLLTVINFCTIQVTWSKVIIEIKFLSYSDRCKEDAGFSKCDPKFKFCLDRPRQSLSMSPCFYGYTSESSHYQDTNHVQFGTNIKGIPNPWIITTDQLMDSAIFLVIQVRDDDLLGDDDHMQTWGTTMTESVKSSENNATWSGKQTSSGAHQLIFQIRIYCETNYYNSKCTRYCLASDGPKGHYTCDLETGAKICLPGWTGSDCTEDINECLLNYCQRGICINLQDDYLCHCPSHYTGKNCTEKESPCDSSPCWHNAVCTNTEDFSYNCTCVGEWEGEHCNIILNPCKSATCQNGAECKPSADHSQYFCACVYPYTGVHCESVSPADVSTSSPKAMSTIRSTTTSSTKTTSIITSAKTLSTSTVRESTGTAANESTNLVPTVNRASEAAGRTDTREAVDSSEEAAIQTWHGAIIAVVSIVLIAIVILSLVLHRRRRKQKLLAENSIAVYNNNNNLAFENNVYNDVGTSDGMTKERQKQHIPLPDTPTEDDQFTPMKPVFTPWEDSDVHGAEGGADTDVNIDMDTDGYMKAVDAEKYNIYTKMIEKPGPSEQGVTNLYSDFNTLKKSEKDETEEVHYHDLDEIAIAVKEYSKVVKERELQQTASCQPAVNKEVTSTKEPYATPAHRKQMYNAEMKKNYISPNIREETTYTDVPNNIPVSFSRSTDAHKPPFNDDFPDDPFISMSLTHDPFSSEDPYIEPIHTNEYTEPAISVFNSWEPEDQTITKLDPTNHSENKMSKEDDVIIDHGIPQSLAAVDGEYSVPRNWQPDHSPVDQPEFQYDTPPRSGSSSLLHTKKELPWLHNGLGSAPAVLIHPTTMPKPPIKCRAKKTYPEETNNVEAKTPGNNNGISLPLLEESFSDQSIDSNGWEAGDYSLPISVIEGHSNRDNSDGQEPGQIKCNQIQRIDLEDSGFSQT